MHYYAFIYAILKGMNVLKDLCIMCMTKKLDKILKKIYCLIYNNVRFIINRIKTNCKKEKY